jgi:hypothetical protein
VSVIPDNLPLFLTTTSASLLHSALSFRKLWLCFEEICTCFRLYFIPVSSRPCTTYLRTRISLLTCAPGEELYSTFGHTAIRVTDSTAGTDEVYNYGTFEFAPDFYYKFVKGKLLYALAVEDLTRLCCNTSTRAGLSWSRS